MRTVIDTALPELTSREQEVIERADALGRGLVAEQATTIDQGMLSLRGTLEALAAAGLAGITVPRAWGGDEVRPAVHLRVLEGLSYGDGTTPFTIAQHYGTATMLSHSPNEELRRKVLPRMAAGQILAGFGISHVRRAGRPAVSATPHGDSYRLDGAIPWMTGYGLFSHVVIAGTLPDGRSLLAWVPFEESAELRVSAPMELVAMNAAQTVSATCEGLEARPAEVVTIEPAGSRERANRPAIPCLYGLIRASVDDLAALAERRNAPASGAAAMRLGARLEAERARFYGTVAAQEDATPSTALEESRAAATQLALDAVGTLIIATGGSANARAHPAQRRLRETSVFATWGLSTAAVNIAVAALST